MEILSSLHAELITSFADLYGRRMPLAAEQDHEVDPADIDLLFPEDETDEEY